MKYITLDTNAWVYLANGAEPAKLLDFLVKEITAGNITLLLPETICSEWNAKKVRTVQQGGLKHYNDAAAAVDNLKKVFGNKADQSPFNFLIDESKNYENFLQFCESFKKIKPELEAAISRNIKTIEELFRHPCAKILPITTTLKLKAADYAVAKKAPFHTKNSFSDALILFSFLDYVKTQNIEDGIFISCNITDYSKSKAEPKEIHPDLEADFVATKSKYFVYIGEAFKTIQDDIISLWEMKMIEDVREHDVTSHEMHFCEVCLEAHDRYNEIFFQEIVDLLDERININDESGDSYRQNIWSPFYNKLKIGYCEYCNTEHFLCAKCGCINSIEDYNYNEEIECNGGCGLTYIVENESIPFEYEDKSYRIIVRKEKCAICDNEFVDTGGGLNTCPRCEDEMNNR